MCTSRDTRIFEKEIALIGALLRFFLVAFAVVIPEAMHPVIQTVVAVRAVFEFCS